MKNVSEILSENSREAPSVGPDCSVFEALQMLNTNNLGALMVIDDHGKILGLFSERDYTRKVELAGRDSKATKVHEVMSTQLVCIRPDDGIDKCFQLMYEHEVRHLPVITRQGKLVGFLAILDVVHSMISEQSSILNQLEEQMSQNWPF